MYGCSADPCLSNNDDGSETLKEKTNLNYVRFKKRIYSTVSFNVLIFVSFLIWVTIQTKQEVMSQSLFFLLNIIF